MNDKNKQTKIGKYEILEKIGEGGFGLVYRGHDPSLNRQVAIKVLKGEVATAPDFVERFRREARLAASLRHANIVNVIEVGEHEGRYYLVMDLLTGGTLSELLKSGQPLLIGRAIELLKPIAEALDFAHRKGMIHRDVKPSNIILNEDGQPVLTDFGLGKSLNESGGTTTGMAMGTAEYMAPEQILGQEPDARTDLYALGVIAYQMLAGQLPFSGTTPFTIQKGHAEQIPPDPRKVNPALGEQIVNILLISLKKQPELRYQSGAEFISALERIASDEEAKYLETLYQDANNLMKELKFSEALEKWEALQKVRPNFRDVIANRSLCRQKMELHERYERLAETLKIAEQEAREILTIDGTFPDGDLIFKRFNLREEHTKDVKIESYQSRVKVMDYLVYVSGFFCLWSWYFLPYEIVLIIEISFVLFAIFAIILNWENIPVKTQAWGIWLSIFGVVATLVTLYLLISLPFLYFTFFFPGTIMTVLGRYLWNKKV